ncbi:MAG: hypothetical protein HPM95_16500 [Alphaproteobacteria bacterium]|nr:hypothetical protein [Alphaproteobacteria bacterium]
MVKAIFFDVFGTVVDWRSGIANALDQAFAKSGADIKPWELADAWRAEIASRLAEATGDGGKRRALSGTGRHPSRGIGESPGDADLARRLGDRDRATLERSWETLRPWPDSVLGLRALRREYGLRPATMARFP